MTFESEFAARPLLEVRDLKKHFVSRAGLFGGNASTVRAVDGVTFDVMPRETLAVVGESGCGKSTAGKCLTRLIEPTSGEVAFDGLDLLSLTGEEMRRKRRDIQMIYQDPYGSLNPRMTVESLLREPLVTHCPGIGKAELDKKINAAVDRIGLSKEQLRRYPHQFSGGQRQRIAIGRALILRPKLIVADEPVSALDVSIQSQILNLMTELQRERGMAYLFISHGLAAVKHISRRIGVMYLGKLMELAEADEIFERPLHPYTQALLSAIPAPDPERKKERIILEGDVPSPVNPPSGCRFRERCHSAMEICEREIPAWKENSAGHYVACHLYR